MRNSAIHAGCLWAFELKRNMGDVKTRSHLISMNCYRAVILCTGSIHFNFQISIPLKINFQNMEIIWNIFLLFNFCFCRSNLKRFLLFASGNLKNKKRLYFDLTGVSKYILQDVEERFTKNQKSTSFKFLSRIRTQVTVKLDAAGFPQFKILVLNFGPKLNTLLPHGPCTTA